MKIEVGKFYKSRNGAKVRIYATDGSRDYPIHGAALGDDGVWRVEAWSEYGRYEKTGFAHPMDLIAEWTEEPEIHWGRIPDGINKICIRPTQGIIDASTGCVVFGATGDDWAFPNWRDFIGQTFTRPKA